MPLYEYYCPSCKSKFELLRPMSRSSEPAACPAGHLRAERVVSLVAARAWDASEGTARATGGCACGAGGACACAGR